MSAVPDARLVAAVLLLAAAVLVAPNRPAAGRRRIGAIAPSARASRPPAYAGQALAPLCGLAVGSLCAVLVTGPAGITAGLAIGALTAAGARRWARGRTAEPPTQPLRLAGAWDLLAACLRAGLPVATATRAVAERLPGPEGRVLRRVAELLATGADAAEAWQPALANPATAALAMAARRTARSGAAMAGAVADLAVQVRAAAGDLAEERAQRAGVLITGPLGLCFLPAFFCLGVLPVVIGLAGQLAEHW